MAAPETRFTTSPRLLVASLERRGPYSGVGESMRMLKSWMDSKGIEQHGSPFCLFYDNPLETPEQELRSEACIPVGGAFEPDGEYRMKEMEDTWVAETSHLGPPEEFAKTYGPFLEGLLSKGYRLAGPAREYFRSTADVGGPGSGFPIQQPIARK